MFRLRLPALVGCVLALGAFSVQAQDADLKAVLKKAIDAHGGEAKMTKFSGVTAKFKGTIQLLGQARDIAGENSVQRPDKLKSALTLDINGMQIPIVVVYDGKKMWRSVMGKTEEIKDEKALTEMRQGLLLEGGATFVDFLKAPYELSALGEVKVKGKDAIGIHISKKGQRDISYFFDKATHLVVKSEARVHDEISNQEVTQEKFIIGYRDTDGLKAGARVVIHKDGKEFMDIEITETKMFEKLDDATFAMP